MRRSRNIGIPTGLPETFDVADLDDPWRYPCTCDSCAISPAYRLVSYLINDASGKLVNTMETNRP